jgi:hypothetical protein
MSEAEEKPETAQQRDIRLLRRILGNEIDSFSVNSDPPCPSKDLLALKALLNEDYISGFTQENGSGFPVQFLGVRVTIRGRALLEELEQKENDRITLPQEIEALKNKIKALSEVEHILSNYWKLADRGERFGMILGVFAVFTVGYLSAKSHLVSSLMDLYKNIKP